MIIKKPNLSMHRGAMERVVVNHTSGWECQKAISEMADKVIARLDTATDGSNCLINILQDIGESESTVVIAVFLTDHPQPPEFMEDLNNNGRAFEFTKDSKPHKSPVERYRLCLVPDHVINRIVESWQAKGNASEAVISEVAIAPKDGTYVTVPVAGK